MTGQESLAFKDLLRHHRLEAGLSQEALAERASLSVRAISDLERGVKQWPRPETLQLLAQALNLSLQDRALLATAARRPRRPHTAVASRRPNTTQPSTPITPSHNLPVQPTSFIGRERERARVLSLLERHHLVTITGAGGAGKTRLALQCAGELVASYPDGVWLVDLAPLGDGRLVSLAVASTLGLREEPGRALPVTIAEYLKPRKLLLVLDNCEHLIAACAELVTVLLRTCPQLRALATSREGLRIAGESSYRVPPLSLPSLGRASPPEQLLAFEAIQLFVERARDRRSDFALTTANAGAVVQICHRLDGAPLAIELAAARIGVLTAEGIADRLGDAFRLLTGGPRTESPRQQTLRATLDWSYNLLGEHEQALLRRLTVFAGGWTLEAAAAICAGDLTSPPSIASTPTAGGYSAPSQAQSPQAESLFPAHRLPSLHADGARERRPHFPVVAEEEVLDLLDTLANKSLVLVEDMGGTTWYRLLETVRQYGRERLEAAGELVPMRVRHLEWYLALAVQAEHGLAGPEQGSWLSRLEREHDNLRAAVAWSLDAPERLAAGMTLMARLLLFWEAHGHLTEARRWLEDLLARGTSAPPGVRARALQCAGALAGSQGDYARATVLLEESLAMQRYLADRQGIVMALQALGLIALYQGDYDRALALCEENVALRREIGDPWGTAAALCNLGQAAYVQGDYERAYMLHEESLALRRQLGNKRGIAVSLGDLGLVAWSRRDLDRAAALHEQSLALRRELGDIGGIAASLTSLGEVTIAQGAYDRAAALLEESLQLSQELGDKQVMAYCLEGLATVSVAKGVSRRAAALFGAAELLRERIGSPLPPAVRADYERSTAKARAALGDDAFVAAWSYGRTLPLDEAIALTCAPVAGATDAVEYAAIGTPGR